MINIILWISTFAAILPVFIGTIRFNRLFASFKIFYYFLIFSVLVDFINGMLCQKGIKTDWIIHFYTPIEFFFVSFVLRSLNANESIKKLIKITAFVLIGIWGVYLTYLLFVALLAGSFDLFKTSFGQSEPISFSIEALTLITFSILLLLNLFSQKNSVSILENKGFWFSLAVLIYFIGNIILYPSLNILVSNVSNEIAQNLWIIHSIFNFTGYLFFTFAFLCKK